MIVLATLTSLGRDRYMRSAAFTLTAVLTGLLLPGSAAAATCADYDNQAQAQRAADTRDSDGDGIYCESLPCPCLKPGGSAPPPPAEPPPPPPPAPSCSRSAGLQLLRFSATKYPTIKLHVEQAIAKGWPRVMVVNRPHSEERRDRLLEGVPTKPGFDRDEYPAAVGRGRANGRAKGLVRGINPIGWMADVAYVPSWGAVKERGTKCQVARRMGLSGRCAAGVGRSSAW
jgi:hypothetical protein